jgi:hypothetical protein
VYKKYQCPTYCGIEHSHYVYFESENGGMTINESELGKKFKEEKKKKLKK